jgi:NDP-sugar pyrophosphorylase family protein
MFNPSDFFDLTTFEHKAIFEDNRVTYVWDVLRLIGEYLEGMLEPEILGQVDPGAYLVGNRIYIAPGARVEPGAYIEGPVYLGAGAVVRHGAYIRGKLIAGKKSLIGHATEVKNAIFLDGAKAAHFAYVGDSILGNNVNLGAGTRLANFKLRGAEVVVKRGEQRYPTGLRKFGAILGDDVSIGCNTVCNPGVLIGPRSNVYALTSVSGCHAAESIIG